MTPTLNWLEINTLVEKIRPEVKGLFVDRIVVPERARFPNEYIKGEWALRLSGRRQEAVLLFSIRARHPYLTYLSGKGPKASSKATHSPFDLSLSKYLKGTRLLDIEALHKERIVILWFSSGDSSSENRLGLILFMIPAVPEAFLVLDSKSESNASKGWPIVARSRTVREASKKSEASKDPHHFHLPSGSKAPENVTIRSELVGGLKFMNEIVEKELLIEAFDLRRQIAEKNIRSLLKQAKDRLRQSETAQREAEKEEDWKNWGDLLKSSLGAPPELVGNIRTIAIFGTGETVEVPCDPKLTIQEQVEKFYQNARRKQRRILEAQSRCEKFRETIQNLERHLSKKATSDQLSTILLPVEAPSPKDWAELEKLERASNTRPSETAVPTAKPGKKSGTAWLGKSFTSVDGMQIWVGRDKNENLELTFKCARGNDIWMHVRGKPGAHVLIPLQSGKSAPLETLLDAAHLVLHYSGGAGWGKTEVDYTFKKYVKRIKDSTEASYTNNKTLLINPDRSRIKKLLDQIGS